MEICNVEYRGFGPVVIHENGSWFFDEDYPDNFSHHILSLRWISKNFDLDTIERILTSFIDYHNSHDSVKSKFYLGKQADHTTSIRIKIFCEMLQKENISEKVSSKIKGELIRSVNSCISDTYKKKNNHGLMVDKAILYSLHKNLDLFNHFRDKQNFFIQRLNDQLEAIFDQQGACKEHSTSYQEYNLGISLDLLDFLSSPGYLQLNKETNLLRERIEKIKSTSQIILGNLLKDDGKYVAIGDSFANPKSQILNKAFGSSDPVTALKPTSLKNGVYFNETIGVAVYRSEKMHLVLNASWHSYVHKQNDDLSLFLRVNSEDIFVEGGYSDIISNSKFDTRSEHVHNTIIPEGYEWKGRGKPLTGHSKIYPPSHIHNNIIEVSGSHSRAGSLTIYRKILIERNSLLRIIDSCSESVDSIHRFMINPDLDMKKIDDFTVELNSKSNKIRLSASGCYDEGKEIWLQGRSQYISNNELKNCKVLDFNSHGSCVITISILK